MKHWRLEILINVSHYDWTLVVTSFVRDTLYIHKIKMEFRNDRIVQQQSLLPLILFIKTQFSFTEHHITFIVRYIVQLYFEIFSFESLFNYTVELNIIRYLNIEIDKTFAHIYLLKAVSTEMFKSAKFHGLLYLIFHHESRFAIQYILGLQSLKFAVPMLILSETICLQMMVISFFVGITLHLQINNY